MTRATSRASSSASTYERPVALPVAQQWIRLLVATDHALMRDGLESLVSIEKDIRIVATASTGLEAVKQYRAHHPDVTLVDLRLPNAFDAGTIRGIRTFDSQARVVVLAGHKGGHAWYHAMRAGATACIDEHVGRNKLWTVVRGVLRGERYVPEGAALRMLDRMAQDPLTAREVEVLRHVARGLSNNDIATQLSIRRGTVKNHVAAIIAKLGAHGRTHAVTLALDRSIFDLQALPGVPRPIRDRQSEPMDQGARSARPSR